MSRISISSYQEVLKSSSFDRLLRHASYLLLAFIFYLNSFAYLMHQSFLELAKSIHFKELFLKFILVSLFVYLVRFLYLLLKKQIPRIKLYLLIAIAVLILIVLIYLAFNYLKLGEKSYLSQAINYFNSYEYNHQLWQVFDYTTGDLAISEQIAQIMSFVILGLALIAILIFALLASPIWALIFLFLLSFINAIKENLHLKAYLGLGFALILVLFLLEKEKGQSLVKIKQNFYLGFFALSLVLITLVNLFLPASLVYNPKLAKKLEELAFQEQDEIVNYHSFDLAQTGFKPNGNKLGGPISPSNDLFMKVVGPNQNYYLTGAIYTKYLGDAWEPSLMNPSYPLTDVEKRLKIFPTRKNILLEEHSEIKIYPIHKPVQVVFHTNHLKSFNSLEKGDSNEAYINDEGQVYALERLTASGYRIEDSPSFNPGSTSYISRLGRLLSLSEKREMNFDLKERIRKRDSRLFDLIYRSKAGPEIKLFLIRNHFLKHYKYELQVKEVPANRDFFDWFLEEKEGYCTYFATAMTLIAKELGFKSRYVEGFVVKGRDGGTVVTSKDSHAWAEVYLDQYGWFPLESTPAYLLSSQPEEEITKSTSQATTPSSQSIETSPSTKVKDALPPSNKITKTQAPSKLIYLGLVILVLALIWIFFAYRYHRRHSLSYHLKKIKQADNYLLTIWLDMKVLASYLGISLKKAVSPLEILQALAEVLIVHRSNQKLLEETILSILYSNREVKMDEVKLVFAYYERLELRAKHHLSFLAWLFKRYFKL